MRTLSQLAVAALLIGFVGPAFAQGTGNASITIEQPWVESNADGRHDRCGLCDARQ